MGESGTCGPAWCELHCHTPYSFRNAGSSIAALVARAAALGMPALAITDTMTLAGVMRFSQACKKTGIRPIIGCELVVSQACFAAGKGSETGTIITLAKDREGYANLCGLLSRANLANPKRPVVPLEDLGQHRTGLLLLLGGCDGAIQRLLVAGNLWGARALAAHYIEHLKRDDLALEVQHTLLPESALLLVRSAQLAEEMGLPCAATNGVHYAVAEDHRVYDALSCVRLGVNVFEPHRERPRNREQHLKDERELRPLFAAAPGAFGYAAAVANECRLELLAERCIPPEMELPAGESAESYLRHLCEAALPERYPHDNGAARGQLEHELAVIHTLQLEEFFLVVWDIMREARIRGARCAGRGSSANSVVAHLLGITTVDPLAHHLLFERFLNTERATMPDIDVDMASSRREEIIKYVEERYGGHEAMVANVVTYRLRLATRDLAKALGFPLPLVDQLTKHLPSFGGCAEIGKYADDLRRALESAGEDAVKWEARLGMLLELAPRLEGFPRHLSLHNGGVLLTRTPLTESMPVRLSANGVLAIEFDKDDVEAMGWIKFDILGLRAFDSIEYCLDLIEETDGVRPDVDALPLDPPDAAAMRTVRSGQTLAVFQLESPAQWHMLAQTQPRTFGDLVVEVALVRPGPIQAGMVHPYVERRAGRAPVRYAHPSLEPILRDTLGIVLYQEQVLQIAHAVAGLSYGQADGFRKAMSHYRTAAEMEGMRGRFMAGAERQGISRGVAERIFNEIACYVGYGFCRSHAAAFAKTTYITAWLKSHYPAHYLAGFLSAQGGFFPASVVLEEAKHLSIPTLPVDVRVSCPHFTVERVLDLDGEGVTDGLWGIRLGLLQVKGVGEAVAKAIVCEREERGQYRSLADFCARVGIRTALRREAVEALVLAGAFDGTGIPRRRLWWLLGERWGAWSTGSSGQTGRKARKKRAELPAAQAALPWVWADECAEEAPLLRPLTLEQEVEWDVATQSMSVRPHPVAFLRARLAGSGILPIAKLNAVQAGRKVMLVGKVISAQRPPTAKGMAFLVLEDETGRVQVALPPKIADTLYRALAESRVLMVTGPLERAGEGRHVSVLAHSLRAVPPDAWGKEWGIAESDQSGGDRRRRA